MMPPFYTSIGPAQWQTFTLALALAIAAGIGLGVWHAPNQRGARVDAYLGTLIGGVIGARVAHVALNWAYFSYHTDEIWRVQSGGLGWHGALIGGLVGLWIAARWRRLTVAPLLDALTPALPLLALAGWWGCAAANCGFGAEVDTLANYPPLLVAELRDVYGIPAPRYNTPLFGLLLGSVALALVGLLFWRGWLYRRRFWLVLALLSAGMFVIGLFRADYAVMVGGLRADQWLDLAVLLVGLVLAVRLQKNK